MMVGQPNIVYAFPSFTELSTKAEMGIKTTNTLKTLLLVLFITKALSQECIVTKDVMDTAVEITGESSDEVISMYDYIEYEDCVQECCYKGKYFT